MFTYSQINNQMLEAVLVVYSACKARSERESCKYILWTLKYIYV